jgi:conjugal transfer pilus assembly protein TraV
MKKHIQLLLLAPALLALGGCFMHTKYDCPAPNGVACMSARQIYSATEDTDTVQKKTAAPRMEADRSTDTSGSGMAIVAGELTLTGARPEAAVDVIPENLPVRMPARILRVWVNAWEDTGGNLHAASTLYTEITPRRWTVGEPAPDLAPHLEPLQPLESGAQDQGQATSPSVRTERAAASNQDGEHLKHR